MTRLCIGCLCGLLSLAAQPGFFPTEDKNPLQQTKALEQVIQKLIGDVEPSIACILVSRSDCYQKCGYEYSLFDSGKLGGYDPKQIEDYLQKKGLPREKREQLIKQYDLANSDNVPEAYGSGVVVDARGLILTHYHVVAGATKIFVRLPGNKAAYADIYAADPRSDLAVLQILDKSMELKPVVLGEGEKVKRGQFVLSLSNPFAAGFADGQPSASWGIVSNIRRLTPKNSNLKENHKTFNQIAPLFQTDVRLQYGCSGGALLNLEGKLIGLTTAQAAIQGLDVPGGFAVSLDETIRKIIGILKKGQEVEYGYLGISFNSAQEEGKGVVISNVTPASPADEKGLNTGDHILTVNSRPIANQEEMSLELMGLFAGETAKLEVRKNGKKVTENITVTLTKSFVTGRAIAAKSKRPYFKGFRVDYTSLVVQCKFPGIQHDSIPKGVVVTDVQPNSSAATALLKPGEIITHVNNQAISNPDQFYQQVQGLKGPVELTLISLQGQSAPKISIN